MNKPILSVVLIAAGLAFALLVWPTPYKYIAGQNGQMHSTIRINRVTGNSWMLRGVAWYPISEPVEPKPAGGLPREALEKITVECQDESVSADPDTERVALADDYISIGQCVFKNATPWTISSITAEVLPIDTATGEAVTDNKPATLQFASDIGPGSSAILKSDALPVFLLKYPPNVTNPIDRAIYRAERIRATTFRVRIVSAVGALDD